jgi:hypothetical protein
MKKFLPILVSLIILSIILVLFLPFIASTPVGKKIVEGAISQKTKGEIEIGSWEFSWFGPQIIHGGRIKNDKIEMTFTEINADIPFWSFLNLNKINEKDLKKLDGKISLKNGQIILYNENDSNVYLKNLDFNLAGNDGENLHFNLKSDSQVDKAIGSILIDGTVANLTDFFNSTFPTIIKVVTVNFPTKSLDIFFRSLKSSSKNKFLTFLKKRPNFFNSLFGCSINANLLIDSKNHKNKILAEIVSTNLKTNLDGAIENKNFYLEKNLTITLQQIKGFANDFIKQMNPIFLTSIASLNSVTLEFFKNGFQIPLDLKLDDIIVPKAILNVQKLKCQNGKLLEAITTVSKLKQNDELTVWCTPLEFQFRNSIFKTNRLDALIENSIHIATFGDMNISKHKLNMVLGIPKDTLEKTFQIKNLPNDFILQVPIKGTFEKPNVKIKQTIAKLIMLLAFQKDQESKTLLKILKKLDKEKFPPPNTPFPWQEN